MWQNLCFLPIENMAKFVIFHVIRVSERKQRIENGSNMWQNLCFLHRPSHEKILFHILFVAKFIPSRTYSKCEGLLIRVSYYTKRHEIFIEPANAFLSSYKIFLVPLVCRPIFLSECAVLEPFTEFNLRINFIVDNLCYKLLMKEIV